MARPARPERSTSARPSRQLSRFYRSINSDMVFGTQAAATVAVPDPIEFESDLASIENLIGDLKVESSKAEAARPSMINPPHAQKALSKKDHDPGQTLRPERSATRGRLLDPIKPGDEGSSPGSCRLKAVPVRFESAGFPKG